MADSATITANVQDGSTVTGNVSEGVSITANVSEGTAITGSVTTGAQGPQGEPGEQGPAGQDGADGVSGVTNHTLLTNIGTNTHAQIDTAISASTTHIANTSNPHSVTKSQVGLGNADNTSDASKPVSTATQTALDGKAASSHTHSIANVTSLQTELDNIASDLALKADTSSVPTELDDLSDVTVPVTTDGDVLTWDDGTSKWIAAAPTGGGGGSDDQTAAEVSWDNAYLEGAYPGIYTTADTVQEALDIAGGYAANAIALLNNKSDVGHTHPGSELTADTTALDAIINTLSWPGGEAPLDTVLQTMLQYSVDTAGGGGGGGITRSVVVTSGNVTADAAASTDYVYLVAGAHTVTLPTAVGNTNRYTVKNIHTAFITVDGDGSETIDGSTTLNLEPDASIDIISNGTNWYII